MAKLFTLTVPDVLWINLRVTGTPQTYSYATLEEGTFYQFQSGQNQDLAGQAARFLAGFRRLAPFAAGNEATAFVGCVAFLEMNGHTLSLTDKEAAKWLTSVWTGDGPAKQTVAAKLKPIAEHTAFGVPDSHEIVEGVLARYTSTIAGLTTVPA